MTTQFVYQSLPSRVVFGTGTLAQLNAELDRLGACRALVLTTPQRHGAAVALAAQMGARAAGIFAGAVMHTPLEVTEQAIGVVAACNVDALVAFGGGSTIGLGKALALRTDLPQIAIPTTYAGSEMTPILGETSEGSKTTQRSPKVLPEVVIYDVEQTLSLPPTLSVTSGLNAMAHAVEALYAEDRNPVVSLLAEDAIRALASALPRIVANPSDHAARTTALYGAWLCGTCLGTVGMALHHKLCHTLGGSFQLPHSDTHAIILPHVVAYNSIAVPDVAARIARALGTSDAAASLYALARDLGAPTALKTIGMPESGIDRAVEIALANPYWNPRPLEPGAIRQLIRDAWVGVAPSVGMPPQ